MPSIVKMLKGDSGFDESKIENRNLLTVLSKSGAVVEIDSDESVGSAVTEDGSIVIVPVLDAIVKYDQPCGPVGMITRARQVGEAADNEQVEAIVFLFDTPGGESGATEVMEKAVQRAKQKGKLTVGLVSGLMCSAGYWIGSACDYLYISQETDIVGSIGTMISLANYDKMLAKEGIEIHDIYADASTDKNKDFKEAMKGNYTPIKQNLLNPLNEVFRKTVTTNRPGLNKSTTLSGRTFIGTSAIKQGLVDGKTTMETLISDIMFTNKFKKLEGFAKKDKLSNADLKSIDKILSEQGFKGVKLVREAPAAILMETTDEAEPSIYVYAEDGEDVVGKRCVYADEAGAPTEDNVEDGDHPISGEQTMTTSTHDDGMSYVDSLTGAEESEEEEGDEDEDEDQPKKPAAAAKGKKVVPTSKGKPASKSTKKTAVVSPEGRAIVSMMKSILEKHTESVDARFEELRSEIGSDEDPARDSNSTITNPKALKGLSKFERTGKTAISSRQEEIVERRKERRK